MRDSDQPDYVARDRLENGASHIPMAMKITPGVLGFISLSREQRTDNEYTSSTDQLPALIAWHHPSS